VDGLDVHQQRVVAQVAALIATGSAYKVFVVSGCTDLQNPALHRDGPHAPVALDEGVLCCRRPKIDSLKGIVPIQN